MRSRTIEKMKNVISVDVEQWFHRISLRKYVKDVDFYSINPEHVVKATKRILEVFDKYDKRTTFFVLGEVAEVVPELVKEIAERGHEVAFHGYSHLRLDEVGRSVFQEGVEYGVNKLYQITKQKVRGFRAPDFSLNNKTIWALRVLESNGFKYDSSLLPTLTPQYGLWRPYFPSLSPICRPYIPSPFDLSREDSERKIVEFPMLVSRVGLFKIPAAGGIYLRLFGPKFILQSIQNMNRQGYPAMCYVHPWEIYGFPKINLPVHMRMYAYHGVPCLEHFEKLVKNVDVTTAIEVLETMGFDF